MFGVLAEVLYFPLDTPHRVFVKSDCHNLLDFFDRMKQTAWPDWDDVYRENDTHWLEFQNA